ncbi:hypothetical protein [Arthrobacter rhombi]|uniref:hypothetical protein n=1 Tax=Arthrobacter rhombi TaxID=71253 RepID=UPI003FD40B24
MCTKDRRCPGHGNTSGRRKHNQRRKDNRKIQKQILEFADGMPEAPDDLADRKIPELKKWAEENGADNDVLHAHGTVPPEDGNAGRGDEAAPGAAPRAREELDADGFLPPAPSPEPRARAVPAGGARHRAPAVGGGGARAGRAAAGRGGGRGVADAGGAGANREKRDPISETDPSCRGIENQLRALQQSQSSHRWEERVLMGSVKSNERLVGGGVNETRVLKYKDGMEGYFKPVSGANQGLAAAFGHASNEQTVNEAAAWNFAKKLGPEYEQLVAPCVIIEHGGKYGSVSFGHKAGRASDVIGRDIGKLPADQADRAAFFDALTGQQDRHRQNFLVDNRGIVLIDHGFGFKPSTRSHMNHSDLQRYRSMDPERRKLNQSEYEVLQKVAHSEDCLGMSSILGDKKADAMKRRAKKMLEAGRVLEPWES